MSQLKNPFFDIDTNCEEFITPVTNAIYQGVMDDQNSTRSNAINRPSSSGKCARSLWYQKNNYTATPIAGRAHLSFMAGHISEDTMKHFILKYCVGENKPFKSVQFGEKVNSFWVGGEEVLQYKQIVTSTNLPSGLILPGAIDGLVQYHDESWAIMDCKSASDYGFADVKKTNDPGDYKYQAHCYMLSDIGFKYNVTKFLFMYMRKTTGHLHDFTINLDPAVINEIDKRFMLANSDTTPPREYEPEVETYYKKPTGRKILPWQCSYCAYSAGCWQGTKKDFKKDQFGNYKPVLVIEDETKGETA
jgi:hypothetical protein